jgi:hypothetical protein
MSNDYLWDRSGPPDLDIRWLEELLAPLAHDAPLDELRLAKVRRSEPARATAQEPIEAPPASGRVKGKGKMNFFDKRVISAAALTAAALGLLGVTAYKRHVDSPAPPPWQPTVAMAPAFAMTPHAPPVVPTTGADLAITVGESARIHAPLGAVDVEIQSKCNAEVEMSVVTFTMTGARPGDLPRQLAVTLRQLVGDPPLWVAGPPSESHALGGDPIVVGTDSADGRTHTYHLVPLDPLGMVQYTSQCTGRPPLHGVLEIDRDDATGPIGPITNARVFNDANGGSGLADHAIHVFGTVMPGAIVSIDGKQITLQPPNPDGHDLFIAPTFSADTPISPEHPVVALRVDDAMGTHFYVYRRSIDFVPSCERTVTGPKQTAANLDAKGDDAAALRTLKAAITGCAPDRETLSLALEYACKAGDVDSARIFWRKLPQASQHTLEPVCAQNSIMRAQLDTR